MIAVLLCAGYATRMYPLTRSLPKPLLPVAGKPVLNYLMEQLLELKGLRTVHVITNARFAPQFESWQKDWSGRTPSDAFAVEIHNDGSTDNDNRLGASADLAWAFRELPEFSRALVVAGDNIFRFPLKPLWEQFLKKEFHWILGLPENDKEKLKKTGVLEFGENHRVLRLHEKPESPPSNWSCPAIYFFQRSVVPQLDVFLNTSEKHDAPGHFIDFLCRNDAVYAFRVRATRLDIGSIDSYHEADRRLRKEPVFYKKEYRDG